MHKKAMEFKDCIYSRRSVRIFTDDKVSDECIRDIIDAGIHAPNACNFAAWKFILITPDTPEQTRKAIRNRIAMNAPYGLLVVYRNDLYVTGRVIGDYIQSASAAIENMLLYINSIGIGGCWICDLPKQKWLRNAFGIPRNFNVIGYVAFGHPDKDQIATSGQIAYHWGDEKSFMEHNPRYSVDQVLCKDEFRKVPNDCTEAKCPDAWHWYKRRIKSILSKFRLRR